MKAFALSLAALAAVFLIGAALVGSPTANAGGIASCCDCCPPGCSCCADGCKCVDGACGCTDCDANCACGPNGCVCPCCK